MVSRHCICCRCCLFGGSFGWCYGFATLHLLSLPSVCGELKPPGTFVGIEFDANSGREFNSPDGQQRCAARTTVETVVLWFRDIASVVVAVCLVGRSAGAMVSRHCICCRCHPFAAS